MTKRVAWQDQAFSGEIGVNHKLVGGERDGEIVEVLYPTDELVFTRCTKSSANPASDCYPDTAPIDNVRYTRRKIRHNGSAFSVFAYSEMTDEQVYREITR